MSRPKETSFTRRGQDFIKFIILSKHLNSIVRKSWTNQRPLSHKKDKLTCKQSIYYPRYHQVTWHIPGTGYTRDPSLTFVYRKQRFYTYLALKHNNTDSYQIIRTLTWCMELAIDVNPKNPLGKRAKLLGPFEQESPRVVPEHLTPPLKSYALNPPNANSCQVC